ncbi:MAG: DUF4258 domain-containing protein [Burkholderiales bacterium]
MARPTITRIRDLVRSLNYAVSIHAAEELEDEKLTILDLENVILTGQIIGRQRDRQTREVKNIIRGQTLDGLEAEAIVKIGPLGAVFIITVYLV